MNQHPSNPAQNAPSASSQAQRNNADWPDADRNHAEWDDPANWRWGVYYSPLDTRVWVPKKPKWMGATLNFAHRASYVWLAVLLSPAVLVAVVACVAAMR